MFGVLREISTRVVSHTGIQEAINGKIRVILFIFIKRVETTRRMCYTVLSHGVRGTKHCRNIPIILKPSLEAVISSLRFWCNPT